METTNQENQTGRPRRDATQVTDFKKYHTTGSTGKVAAAVLKIETPEKEHATPPAKTISTRVKRTLSGDNRAKPRGLPSSPQEPAVPEDIPEGTGTHQEKDTDKGSASNTHASQETPQASLDSPTPQVSPDPPSPHPPSPQATARMSEIEQLKEELRKQKELNEQVKGELEAARLRAEIQEEKRKQLEWEAAKEKLDREQAAAEATPVVPHKEPTPEPKKPEDSQELTIQFLKTKLEELTGKPVTIKTEDPDTRKKKEVADQLKELMKQQQELAKTAKLAAQGCDTDPAIAALLSKLTALEQPKSEEEEQAGVLEKLLATLQGKEADSIATKQKDILKQFLVDANKVTTTGGATTLKPELLKKLTGESDVFNMAEWLAKLNRHTQEEGKCDACQEDCKHHRKSGMLDKATTNIQHKEIWPQKNLLEDWADEDMEFKTHAI